MALLFFLLFCANDLLAEEETTKKSGKTKILVGVGLMGGGAALAIHGGSKVFQDGEAEFFTGIGIFGAGAVVTLLGISQELRSKNAVSTSLKDEVEVPLEILFIAGPTRKGMTAGMTIKW
jgi:hypothetical protein